MYRKVLANQKFLKLWGAQVFSQVAAQLLNYGLIIRIFDVAKGTSFASSSVSLLIIAIGLPAIFLAVPAGAYVDRQDRKRVLVVTNLMRALLVPLFIFSDKSLLPIYLLAFAISIFSQFFVPAEGAALPRLVTKKELVVANSFFIFTLNASFIVGYSLAAPLIAGFGFKAVYLIATASFLIALILTSLLPAMPSPNKVDFKLTELLADIRKDLRLHFTTIIATRTLLFPILLISIAQTIVGIIAALAPALSLKLFNVSLAESSHWLVIPAGLGLVIGSIAAGRVMQRVSKVRVIFTSLFLSAIALITLSQLSSLGLGDALGPAVALTTFGLGLFDAFILVAAQTLLQLASTDRLRGQIFGTLNMMINIAALAPVFFAAILADIFTPLIVLGGIGILLILVGILFIKIFRQISSEYA